jgi:hypothetical protein
MALHRRVPSLSNYAATSITKHYQLNKQILTAFDGHLDAKLYKIAYAIGLQFVETALLEIPKHGYFYSPRHETERMESSLEAVRVTNLLQDIQTNLGDVYSEDLDHVHKLHELAVQQVEQASEDQYESQRARTERDLRASVSTPADWVVLDPFLICQESLSSLFCPNPTATSSPETIPVSSLNKIDSEDIITDLLDRDVPVESMPSKDWSEHREQAPMVPEANLLGLTTVPFKNPPTGPTSNSRLLGDSSSPSPSHGRPETWSIPPSNLAVAQSWGQPPPLVAQENSYMISRQSNRAVTTPQAPSVEADTGLLPPQPLRQRSMEPMSDEEWDMIQRPGAPNNSHQRSFSNLVPQTFHRHARTDSSDDKVLQRALFLSGLEVVDTTSAENKLNFDIGEGKMPTSPVPQPPAIRMSSSSRIDFGTLSSLYHEDFDQLVRSQRIRVTTIPTYQGRIAESTNGCTVIAPLMCMHHLLNDDGPPEAGLPDSGITQVIDEETPVILGDLRRRLGLADQAFLIPSDVHDYLIENGQLHQSQFVDVMGGNMLLDGHLENFVSSLANSDIPKLAATLFFHEHVVCILKLERGNGIFWYDLIDSLPLPETLQFSDESEESFYRRFGIQPDDPMVENAIVPFSIRLRCIDTEALQACLRWYACSKFTDENIRYIDQYEWDEAQSDFDPRVFQGFIWGSPKS